MHSIFVNPDTDGVLLVDATNVFNSLNCQVGLTNSSLLYPAIHPILVNSYRRPSYLFVRGETLLSQEVYTQGDLLAIAISVLPRISQRCGGVGVTKWNALVGVVVFNVGVVVFNVGVAI